MGIWDLIFLISYLALIVYFGLKFSKQNTKESYFLGNKNLHWSLILFSIVATETSSLTFLNIPSISYKGDLNFLQIALGFIIGRFLVSAILIPFYFKEGYSSIYELVKNKFGVKAQKLVSGIFLISRILGDGIRLYATSIPISFLLKQSFLNNFSDTEIRIFSLLLITILTGVYTILGGFQSVIITDSIQFFIYIFGGIYSFYFLYSLLNLNSTEIISILSEKNKLQIFDFKGTLNLIYKIYITLEIKNFLSLIYSLFVSINGVIAGIFISIGSHGVDQMFAQRYLATKNEKESKLALNLSGIIVFFQFCLFLGIGLLLSIYYSNEVIKGDKVFSKFITEKIPSPLLGIILAAILASAMSTLSSSINSMSMTIVYDWLKNKDSKKNNILLSLIWSLVLFFSSMLPYFFTEDFGKNLVEIGLKIASYFYGSLIGLFFYIRFTKSKKEGSSFNCILSLLISIFITIYLSFEFKLISAYLIPVGILSFYIPLILMNFLNRNMTFTDKI